MASQSSVPLQDDIEQSGTMTPPPTTTEANISITPKQSRSMLNEVLTKCVTLTPDQLKDDDTSCGICQTPFLTSAAPELPLQLPCGHVCGSACILKWLNPLSQEAHNSCPMCRQPILQISDPVRDLKWLNELRAWRLSSTPWRVQAEHLFCKFCEAIVIYIEEESEKSSTSIAEAADTFMCSLYPLKKLIVCASLGGLMQIVDDPSHRDHDMLQNLLQDLPDPQVYETMIAHARTKGEDVNFADPDEEAFARLSGWHRRIRECYGRLLTRLERDAGLLEEATIQAEES